MRSTYCGSDTCRGWQVIDGNEKNPMRELKDGTKDAMERRGLVEETWTDLKLGCGMQK